MENEIVPEDEGDAREHPDVDEAMADEGEIMLAESDSDQEETEPETTPAPESLDEESGKEPPAAPGDAAANEAILLLEMLRDRMDDLHGEFQSKLKYDQHKERIIDKLHRELQEYKDDMLKKLLRSVIMDVIKVADDIRKVVNHYRSMKPENKNPEKLLDYLSSIPQDLDDVFAWQDVKSFSCDGPRLDISRQRVTKKIVTEDKTMDKIVAESLRPGYEWDGRVIRPEMVSVFIYEEPDTENTETRSTDERADE
ncbi:MAG: nucleotide exchange factor GrpE [Desulfobacterales bacterium]|nr:nucleotide exchange factor GrpE [Desulfobacterales bacterium]